MPVIAIEIHDVGMNAVGDSGPIGAPSPGYALLDRRDILVGEAARAAARLKPRFVSHRHWDRLDMESVGRPFPRGLSHADLVHAHLSTYWTDLVAALEIPTRQISVLLAVPGSYSLDQLGLLLGIARSCEMPISGLVDGSLAALGGSAAEGRTLHVDVQQHRAVLSVIESGERRARVAVESVETAGIARFQQAWVRRLADRFVRQTRFDPLHRGASEQQLYDRLPEWAREISANGGAALTLGANDRPRTVEVTAEELVEAASAPIDAVAEAARPLLAEDAALALSARAARLPGLAERLAELAAGYPVRLPEGAEALGALRHREEIEAPGHELPLVLDLPVQVFQ